MEPKQQKSLGELITERIEHGHIIMRPRWHFVLKTALGIVTVALVFLAALYFLSFIVFALRASGIWFTPAFGLRGVTLFLFSLPWLLVLLSLLCIFLLELLVRKYAFAYRKPLLYSIVGIGVLVIAGSVAVGSLRLHERFLDSTKGHPVPLLGTFYRGYASPHQKDVHPVLISSTTERGFIAVTRGGDTIEIIISPDTRLPFGFDFTEGDETVILGEKIDGSIEAIGIAPMHASKRPGRRHPSLSPMMRMW